MSEDSHDLRCESRLINLGTESGKRAYGAMKQHALDGLLISCVASDERCHHSPLPKRINPSWRRNYQGRDRFNVAMVEKAASSRRTRTGTVIWFNAMAGYGFIKPDEGGADIFARVQIKKSAKRPVVSFAEGERVRYALVASRTPARTEVLIFAGA
jgi:cold shock protein